MIFSSSAQTENKVVQLLCAQTLHSFVSEVDLNLQSYQNRNQNRQNTLVSKLSKEHVERSLRKNLP